MWRHVLVNDAVVVHVRKRIRDLGERVDGLARCWSALPFDEGPGVEPLDELHHDEVRWDDPGVEDGDDVRVRQPSADLPLSAEAPHEERLAAKALGDDP